MLQTGGKLPRPHHQSSRLILEGINQVTTLRQTNAVVKGQIRGRSNDQVVSIRDVIGVGHNGILATPDKNAQTSIKLWGKQYQPREKLLQSGPSALNDAELLSIIIRTGSQGENSLDLSKKLLTHFGSISSLLNSRLDEFKDFKGIGLSKWAQLRTTHELVRRSQLEQLQRQDALGSIDMVKSFLINTIGHKDHEVFVCLYLDIHHRLIHCEEIFRGSINQTAIYIREVVKACLLRNCSNLIVAHNHPSGHLTPSQEDISVTQMLAKSLALIEVQLLDHCIVSKNGAISMLELAVLPQ